MDDHIQKTVDVYNKVAGDYAKQAKNNAPQIERERFVSLIEPPGMVLDVGCGSGRDCGYFVDKGFQVTGIDLSDKLLDIAKKSVPGALCIKQDMRNIILPEKAFDGIWSCASLLHLKHDEISGVLTVLYSLLKPHGVIFILVKAGAGEHYKEEQSIPKLKRFYSFHSKESITEHLTKSGFAIIDCYTYNVSDRSPEMKDSWWIASFGKKGETS